MGKKITTSDFIKKVNERFPTNTDDLSMVKYVKSNKKVIFVCQKHGEYEMAPSNYLNGQRCPKCKYETIAHKRKKYKNNEDFKNDIIDVHGEKYDLSRVDYKSLYKKVTIGYRGSWFDISPCVLLKGGEPIKIAMKKMGIKKRMTTDQFIQKARKIYGDKYDYSKVKYIDSHTPVCIILHEFDYVTDTEYGEFWVSPNKHLMGGEHPKLSGRGYTKDELIYYFNKIHRNKYDYTQIVVHTQKKQPIICPQHGVFYQSLYKHKNGEGCPKCGGKLQKKNSEFIKELKKIYGDKYDLSKVQYKNARTKVILGCKKHGEYEYLPSQLLSGSGCKFCKCSKLENEIEQILRENSVKFISQCNCIQLKWLGKQSVDFFLPKYNVAIECQGCQHFRPIKAFQGEPTFYKTLKRDDEKRRKFIENNVKLVYYTNEHTIPLQFNESFFIYRDKKLLINDIINNNIKDIYYATTNTKKDKGNKT